MFLDLTLGFFARGSEEKQWLGGDLHTEQIRYDVELGGGAKQVNSKDTKFNTFLELMQTWMEVQCFKGLFLKDGFEL